MAFIERKAGSMETIERVVECVSISAHQVKVSSKGGECVYVWDTCQ